MQFFPGMINQKFTGTGGSKIQEISKPQPAIFIDENTLSMNWHDTLFIQIFKKVNENEIILKMKYPANENTYDLVLEVTFTR